MFSFLFGVEESHLSTYSEQGNSAWKPDRTLWLVHAAINDISIMMIQDKEIILYLNNECTSSGKGPNQVGFAERDRKQQMTTAVDFSNSANSEENITQQVNEVLNTTYYMPCKDSGFKPPKEKKTTLKRKMDDKCTSTEKKNGKDREDICSKKSKKKKAAEDNNEEEIVNMENKNDEKTQSGNDIEDEESELQNTLKIIEEICGRVIRPLTEHQK